MSERNREMVRRHSATMTSRTLKTERSVGGVVTPEEMTTRNWVS
jgi:hypothetical protein